MPATSAMPVVLAVSVMIVRSVVHCVEEEKGGVASLNRDKDLIRKLEATTALYVPFAASVPVVLRTGVGVPYGDSWDQRPSYPYQVPPRQSLEG